MFAGSPSIAQKRRLPRIKVSAVAIDPTYNGRKVERDFAVLTLASAPAAQPIDLPSRAGASAAACRSTAPPAPETGTVQSSRALPVARVWSVS